MRKIVGSFTILFVLALIITISKAASAEREKKAFSTKNAAANSESSGDPESPKTEGLYEWSRVEQGSDSSGVAVTGRIIPQDGALSVESARTTGRVLALLKREGESVAPGSEILEVSSAECFSLMEEKRVANSKSLPELVEGVSRREKQLGLSLKGDRCFVTASHAGVITKRLVESGASFNSGDALFNVLDTHRLAIELDIPERDQDSVRVGQSVRLELASHRGEFLKGKIQTIVPAIDPLTRTSKARVSNIQMPKVASLESLVFGQVETGEKTSVLTVPSSAILFSNHKQFVVTGGVKATPKAVAITVINESDSTTSIRPVSAGTLKAGDQVASRGGIFLLKKVLDGEAQANDKSN